MRALRPGSIRQRFLLVVLCGAVLPLAVAGAFLAQSSVRSAEGLLRTQLDTALTTIAVSMDRRWDYRRGDLLMLAGNEVVRRTMVDGAAPASTADSAYLAKLYSSVSTSIPYLRFRTNAGEVRWEFGRSASSVVDSGPGGGVQGTSRDPRLTVTYPVQADGAPALGTLEAEVRLSAMLPVDSIPILLNGATLSVADGRTGQSLALVGLGDAPIDGNVFTLDGERWLSQHRTVAASLLVITAAAPTRDYVAPFERTARVGLLVLIGVMLLSLALSMFFTGRITRSLERLAAAADAVARGDLGRNVETNGEDEVGRLARSFNTMTESLRRTLRELSQREALAAVGEFATSLSHEVRNGLTAVRVDLERTEESGPTAPESAALVSRALRNVLRLNSTVTGALSVARSGRATSQLVDLNAVLRVAVAASESAYRGTGSTLVTPDLDAPSLHVRGDAVSLEQLFLNLLLNAGQAMSSAGVAHLEIAIIGSDCVVSLRDAGPGMSPDLLAGGAEPYVSSKRGGTGLGLSIARKIAEGHGGALHLENAAGGGLVASVRLPVAREVA